MRAVLLTTYFPKPANPVMGIWALREAQALRRMGCELFVVSPTSWVPRLPLLPARLRAWADCPPSAELGGVRVDYPRWPLWQVGALGRQAARDPRPQLELALKISGRRLRKLLESHKPDLIYAHHAATCGWAGAALAEELKLPLVTSEHALPGLLSCAFLPGMRATFARVAERANRIVSVSRLMEASWQKLFPDARTTAVFNGADPLPANLQTLPRPERLRDRIVIACTASLHLGKGVVDLIEAFAPLARENPKLLLRVAGEGPERRFLEELAEKRGVASQLELLGSQSHEQVLEMLVHADLFALLTRDEAFGVAYLEAMSAGLPVIWTTAAGFRECVQTGINGYEVRAEDVADARTALAALLAAPALRRKMGEANRKLLSAELTWDAHAKKLLAIFEDAVREGAR